MLNDVAVTIDGRPLVAGDAMVYKGMMLGDVPNLAMAFGYTNASWTLKADLTAAYVCRLLRYMDRHGFAVATPRSDRMFMRYLAQRLACYLRRTLGIRHLRTPSMGRWEAPRPSSSGCGDLPLATRLFVH